MLNRKSTQAIETFYLKDDPTVILESEEEAATFNAELKAQVQRKLVSIANSDAKEQAWETRTAENPFSYDYVLERLEHSIHEAEAKNDNEEVTRLALLLKKLQTQELFPVQVVRKAWLKA